MSHSITGTCIRPMRLAQSPVYCTVLKTLKILMPSVSVLPAVRRLAASAGQGS